MYVYVFIRTRMCVYVRVCVSPNEVTMDKYLHEWFKDSCQITEVKKESLTFKFQLRTLNRTHCPYTIKVMTLVSFIVRLYKSSFYNSDPKTQISRRLRKSSNRDLYTCVHLDPFLETDFFRVKTSVFYSLILLLITLPFVYTHF